MGAGPEDGDGAALGARTREVVHGRLPTAPPMRAVQHLLLALTPSSLLLPFVVVESCQGGEPTTSTGLALYTSAPSMWPCLVVLGLDDGPDDGLAAVLLSLPIALPLATMGPGVGRRAGEPGFRRWWWTFVVPANGWLLMWIATGLEG